MKEEISKVIAMVQEEKISPEKAVELIQTLKEKVEGKENNKSYIDKTLKIRILSKENERVNVNVPMRLVKPLLKAGHSIAVNVPEAEKYVKDLDINLLIDAIENELEGQIVDIESHGETVAVYVE